MVESMNNAENVSSDAAFGADFGDSDDFMSMDPFDEQDVDPFGDPEVSDDHERLQSHIGDAASEAEIPTHLMYSQDHVWVDDDTDPVVCGITAYAAEQLGDLVFIDLPQVGKQVEVGDEIVQLESSKAISPVISPVSGTVVYVNNEAYEDPSVVNTDPYGEGWLVKIECDEDSELLTAQEYKHIIG